MKPQTIATLLLISVLSSCAPPAADSSTQSETLDPPIYGKAQTYIGTVGTRDAVFTLDWQADGIVNGYYYNTDVGPGIRYVLKGNNTASGELVLTEYSPSVQTAVITLKKSVSRGQITWSGKMHNTDGNIRPVKLTRQSS